LLRKFLAAHPGDTTISRKKWTIMLYFSADCNLASEMIAALREMHRVGSNDTFDVVVQLDGILCCPSRKTQCWS